MRIAAGVDDAISRAWASPTTGGNNPAALFVPDPRLAPGGIDELRMRGRAPGIEVILDVVLNHTGEGDALVRLDSRSPSRHSLLERRGLCEKASLGLLDAAGASAARAERVDAKRALAKAIDAAGVAEGVSIDTSAPHVAAITSAVHRYVSATSSVLALIQADDLAGETMALNLLGTDRGRPNWRRKVDVETLWRTPCGAQAIVDLSGVRTRR